MVEFLAIGAHAVRRAEGCRTGAGCWCRPDRARRRAVLRLVGLASRVVDGRGRGSLPGVDRLRREASGHPKLGAKGYRQSRMEKGSIRCSTRPAIAARWRQASAMSLTAAGMFSSASSTNPSRSWILISTQRDDLLASRNATIEDFERVVEAIRDREVPVECLVTHRTSLAGGSMTYPIGPLRNRGSSRRSLNWLDVHSNKLPYALLGIPTFYPKKTIVAVKRTKLP